MLECISRIRTPEQRAKKMINEERTIMDLQLAIKKEEFKNHIKTIPEFDENYKKISSDTTHDCMMFDL